MKVTNVGKDLRLIAHNKGEGGVWRYGGKLPYYDDFVNVVHEISAKQNWFYANPPAKDLPRDELNRYDEKAKGIVLDIRKTLIRKYEWALGDVEDTNWAPYFGTDSSAPMGQYASKYRMTSDDGIATTSSSDGRDEMELQARDGLEYAKPIWSFPIWSEAREGSEGAERGHKANRRHAQRGIGCVDLAVEDAGAHDSQGGQ